MGGASHGRRVEASWRARALSKNRLEAALAFVATLTVFEPGRGRFVLAVSLLPFAASAATRSRVRRRSETSASGERSHDQVQIESDRGARGGASRG